MAHAVRNRYVVAVTLALLAVATAQRAHAGAFERWTGTPRAAEARTLAGPSARIPPLPGRVTIVHFFATWCEPCREELASLERLYAQDTNAKPVIVAVDVGEPESRVRRFFERFPVSFTIALDPEKSAMRAWRVEALPSSFVFSADGCRRWRIEGELDWTSAAASEVLAQAAAVPDRAVKTSSCTTKGETQ